MAVRSTATRAITSGVLAAALMAIVAGCGPAERTVEPIADRGDHASEEDGSPRRDTEAESRRSVHTEVPAQPSGVDGVPAEFDVTIQSTPWEAYLTAWRAYRDAASVAAAGDIATVNGFLDPMLGDLLGDLHSLGERGERRVVPVGASVDAELIVEHVNAPDEVVLEVCVRDQSELIDASTRTVLDKGERVERVLVEMRFEHDRWAQSKQQYLARALDGTVTSTDSDDGAVGCFGL